MGCVLEFVGGWFGIPNPQHSVFGGIPLEGFVLNAQGLQFGPG